MKDYRKEIEEILEGLWNHVTTTRDTGEKVEALISKSREDLIEEIKEKIRDRFIDAGQPEYDRYHTSISFYDLEDMLDSLKGEKENKYDFITDGNLGEDDLIIDD